MATQTSSAMERGVVRLAIVAAAFAVAAAAFGMWPGGVATAVPSAGSDELFPRSTASTGGWGLVVWAAAQVALAFLVWKRPTPPATFVWIVGVITIAGTGLLVWATYYETLGSRNLLWAGKMMMVCSGAAAVLMFLVLPVVVIAGARKAQADGPRARVVER